jgi:HEAT repeat protein
VAIQVRSVRAGVASGLVAALALTQVAPVPTFAAQAKADSVAELLSSGALRQTTNPVLADYVLEEGAAALSEEQRMEAIGQLKDALKSQTNVLGLLMQGTAGMMNSPAMEQAQKQAQKAMSRGGLIGMAVGVAPATAKVDPQQIEREMQAGFIDPWVRAIAAAEALARSGDANAAGRFYVSCLQFLPQKWVPEACLEGAIGLGPTRAFTLLDWMWREAEQINEGPLAGIAGLNAEPGKKGAPDAGVVQVRNAALKGLGALVGSGALSPDLREKAMASLLSAEGKGKEPYSLGAADGLGRSRDPRAVEPLRHLAKIRSAPDTKQAALRGLATGFKDEGARKQLRGELDDKDPEDQLRAAQALYEAGDEAAFKWAVDVITKRRTMDTKEPDIRAMVVRDLVELGGPRARQALSQALADGPGNDWLAAWVRVALLELGDASQLSAVEAAIAKDDWSLDPRGFRSVWRALAPFIMAAAVTILTGGLAAPTMIQQIRQATSLIGNFISGERSIYLTKANQREAAIAQIRWQAADALAAANVPGAVRPLLKLLADGNAPVRLSAALAFSRLDQPESLDGLARAYALEYAGEKGVSRTPEVRASLLRAALLRFPKDARTRQLISSASTDSDSAVRFIGLTATARSAS